MKFYIKNEIDGCVICGATDVPFATDDICVGCYNI